MKNYRRLIYLAWCVSKDVKELLSAGLLPDDFSELGETAQELSEEIEVVEKALLMDKPDKL